MTFIFLLLLSHFVVLPHTNATAIISKSDLWFLSFSSIFFHPHTLHERLSLFLLETFIRIFLLLVLIFFFSFSFSDDNNIISMSLCWCWRCCFTAMKWKMRSENEKFFPRFFFSFFGGCKKINHNYRFSKSDKLLFTLPMWVWYLVIVYLPLWSLFWDKNLWLLFAN